MRSSSPLTYPSGKVIVLLFRQSFPARDAMTRQGTLPARLKFSARLLRQYRAEKITLQQLAAIHDVSVSTVWRELRRRGVCRGSRRGRPPNKDRHTPVMELAAQGWSRRQIADHLGVTPEWVRCILAEHGLAVSLQILKCRHCGAPIASGHKARQAEGDPRVLCVACLRQLPDPPFTEVLRTLRLAGNLSLAQLSARSGLSRALLWNYERGLGRPSWESACRLAVALGVSVSALVGQRRTG
jgi:DNA-binding XRE family transcriptional regulator